MKNIVFLCLLFIGSIVLFSSCEKELSNETGVTQIAEGSLQDSLGNCSPDSIIGTYYSGITPGKDTAYVQVQVNVTKVGSYTITTDLENGFQFADSGFFTTTGINTVLLKPLGTPILPNTTTFNVMFDSSLCNFTVNVKDSTGTGIHSGGGDTTVGAPGDPDAVGSWQFTSNGHVYSGSDLSTFEIDTLGKKFLVINSNGFNVDTLLTIVLPLSGSTAPAPGSYNSNDLTSLTGLELDDLIAGTTLFKADPVTPTASLIIKVVSYDATTKLLTGTFSGTAFDDNGTLQTITAGTFSVVVQ